MGLAQNRISSYPDMFGALHTTSRLVWTEKGREFVYRLRFDECAQNEGAENESFRKTQKYLSRFENS
jgi:hypothetical protein